MPTEKNIPVKWHHEFLPSDTVYREVKIPPPPGFHVATKEETEMIPEGSLWLLSSLHGNRYCGYRQVYSWRRTNGAHHGKPATDLWSWKYVCPDVSLFEIVQLQKLASAIEQAQVTLASLSAGIKYDKVYALISEAQKKLAKNAQNKVYPLMRELGFAPAPSDFSKALDGSVGIQCVPSSAQLMHTADAIRLKLHQQVKAVDVQIENVRQMQAPVFKLMIQFKVMPPSQVEKRLVSTREALMRLLEGWPISRVYDFEELTVLV